MPSSFFFARLVPHRPDFATTMTAAEQATMRTHIEFLQSQIAAGKLVAAGPVLDPAGVYGIAVIEAESLDEVRLLLDRDPGKAVGRYDITPMGAATVRPARPAGS